MKKDRNMICETISEMLDNPDDNGIYPTTHCYDRLEKYIEQQRMETIDKMMAALRYQKWTISNDK